MMILKVNIEILFPAEQNHHDMTEVLIVSSIILFFACNNVWSWLCSSQLTHYHDFILYEIMPPKEDLLMTTLYSTDKT